MKILPIFKDNTSNTCQLFTITKPPPEPLDLNFSLPKKKGSLAGRLLAEVLQVLVKCDGEDPLILRDSPSFWSDVTQQQ